MRGERQFGKMTSDARYSPPPPSARDASTNSFSRIESTLARVIRAKAGMEMMPIAIIAFSREGLSTAIKAIAKRIAGKASRASITRMISPSIPPPR